MPGPNLPTPQPPGEQLAPIGRQLDAMRTELDQLDEKIAAIDDLARRDRCMAWSQAIRVGIDRLEDLVAQLATGL